MHSVIHRQQLSVVLPQLATKDDLTLTTEACAVCEPLVSARIPLLRSALGKATVATVPTVWLS
jgi:hypothetical protein